MNAIKIRDYYFNYIGDYNFDVYNMDDLKYYPRGIINVN